MSKPRLHVSSTHTRVAMRARLGRVFLSVTDDRVLAKAHGLALRLSDRSRFHLGTACRLAISLLSAPIRGSPEQAELPSTA
jgi:hypothetical protein